MSYWITVATIISIQAIAAYGLNITLGFAGQISIGHAAFIGIGAYTAALLATKAGWPFFVSLPVVMIVSGLTGLALGVPSLRLRDDFLAITTIGINFIIEAVFRYVSFFGGAMGIGDIPMVQFCGIGLKGASYLLLCLFFLCAVMLLSWWFSKAWIGLAFFALREDESASASLGISPVRFKLMAFVAGTTVAGLSGALYAHFMKFISPTDFTFPFSVMMLSVIVLGGMGTLWGPILGATILGIMPEIFRPLVDYRFLLYMGLLVVMIRFQPGGLLGEDSVCRQLFVRYIRFQSAKG